MAPSAENRALWLSRAANFGLILFLAGECAYGTLYADDSVDIVWWIIVSTILLVNVMRRGPAVEKDSRWWVWIVCAISILHVMAFEYGDESRIAFWVLVFIIVAADLNQIYLGKSFAILPARRAIRSGWAYRLVRHPIYACYILADIIFLTQVPTIRNAAVLAVGAALFAIRAGLEERLLRNDPVYVEYSRRTCWRFLPYLY